MPSQIVPYLSQGGVPEEGGAVARAGFKVLVLCADEYQPSDRLFHNLDEVIHAPNDDGLGPFTKIQKVIARLAANRVADHVRAKQHVLVTCMAGRNRSGLVTALALHKLYGWSGARCIHHVQAHRENALTNPDFVDYLKTLPVRKISSTTSSHG
jgi:protein-tyrosine phosphatase